MEEVSSSAPSNANQPKVIIPPPDIKVVIDNTANYVAKNGVSFEALIMKVEANNNRFNFLRYHDDPYRPYYQLKITEKQKELGKLEDTKTDGDNN